MRKPRTHMMLVRGNLDPPKSHVFPYLEVGDTSSMCAKDFTNKDLAATQESLHTTQPL